MFATTRWNTLPNFWSHVSRLHDEMSRELDGPRRADEIRVNAWEEGDRLFVETELPGLRQEDLEITVESASELTIKGEIKTHDESNGKWLRRERRSGKFERSFKLPFDVDTDEVEAQFKDGVLRIELPKREEDKSRRIDVKLS